MIRASNKSLRDAGRRSGAEPVQAGPSASGMMGKHARPACDRSAGPTRDNANASSLE